MISDKKIRLGKIKATSNATACCMLKRTNLLRDGLLEKKDKAMNVKKLPSGMARKSVYATAIACARGLS